MTSVGDQVTLIRGQDGKYHAKSSGPVAIGDQVQVYMGSDGKWRASKSGTPTVGSEVLLTRSDTGKWLAHSSILGIALYYCNDPAPSVGAGGVIELVAQGYNFYRCRVLIGNGGVPYVFAGYYESGVCSHVSYWKKEGSAWVKYDLPEVDILYTQTNGGISWDVDICIVGSYDYFHFVWGYNSKTLNEAYVKHIGWYHGYSKAQHDIHTADTTVSFIEGGPFVKGFMNNGYPDAYITMAHWYVTTTPLDSWYRYLYSYYSYQYDSFDTEYPATEYHGVRYIFCMALSTDNPPLVAIGSISPVGGIFYTAPRIMTWNGTGFEDWIWYDWNPDPYPWDDPIIKVWLYYGVPYTSPCDYMIINKGNYPVLAGPMIWSGFGGEGDRGKMLVYVHDGTGGFYKYDPDNWRVNNYTSVTGVSEHTSVLYEHWYDYVWSCGDGSIDFHSMAWDADGNFAILTFRNLADSGGTYSSISKDSDSHPHVAFIRT
jgi:hypothetical protein